MPPAVERKVKSRGGAVRVRTVRVAPGKYAHVYVVRRKGPRGGRTVLGQVKRTRP